MDGYSLCYIAVIHVFHNHWMTSILENGLPPKKELCWKCGFFSGLQVDFQLDSRQPSVGRLSSFGVQKCTPPSNMGYIYIYIYVILYIYI